MTLSRTSLLLTLFAAFLAGACGAGKTVGGALGGGGTGSGGGTGGGSGSGGGTGGSGGGGAGSSPDQSFLMDLHLHGSLSEGFATMESHTAQAEISGFDGLWWTDHMGRQLPDAHQHAIDFEGDLNGSVQFGSVTSKRSIQEEASELSSYVSSFDDQHSTEGEKSFHVDFSSGASTDWQLGSLTYKAANKAESISLVADPRVGFDFRMEDFSGDVGLAVRITLSSTFDNGIKGGKPRVLQFTPAGFQVPPSQDAIAVSLPASSLGEWVHFECDVRAQAARFWDPVDDLSLKKVEILLATRDGGHLAFSLDTFRIGLFGATGAEIFRSQKRTLAQYYSENLFHHVGAEMGGPFEQEITSVSTRDHLITLLPENLGEVMEFPEGSVNALEYPRSGVEWIHQRQGAAILAHVFGASHDGETPDNVAKQLIARLHEERAFGADGMEVAYVDRGRPMADFVKLWDQLADEDIYLTGVGSSDNHNLERWSERTNRMATWIVAQEESASNLCAAIKGGHAFFGDPHVMDPNSELLFEEAEGAYSMGDVVPLPKGTQQLKIEVDGARAGDSLVLLKNGIEESRWSFDGQSLQVSGLVTPQAGDWVRLEVRDSSESPILFSNPIYYIAAGATPPVNRAP